MNKSELDRLLNDFYVISGMEISVLDEDFHTISMKRSEKDNFCSLLHRENGMSGICSSSDIDRLTEAKTTLAPVLYTCPAGITEVIAPIVQNERVRGYIIASMGINLDTADDALVLDMVRGVAPDINIDLFSQTVRSTRHLTREEVDAYFGLISILAEYISNDETVFAGEESIGRLVKYYVKSNLERKITLRDIARSLHCSTVTLTEHFKSEFGITIMEYVMTKRMQFSEKLLISTSEPLSVIAALSGFSDVEYFSRTFKKHHGISPTVWRKKNK